MVIYVLLITMIGLLILSFAITKRDIFSPSCIICVSYILSILACMYNIERWGVDLRWVTYGYIAGGMLIFVLSSFLVQTLATKPRAMLVQSAVQAPTSEDSTQDMKRPEIQTPVVWLLVIFCVFVGVLYLQEVFRIAGHFGVNLLDWNAVMSVFRMQASYGILDADLAIPRWISWTYTSAVLVAYPTVFCLVRALVEKKRIRLSMIILALVCMTLGLFSGGRMQAVLGIPSAAVIFYVILWHRKHGWHRQISYRVLFRCIIIFLLVMAIFFVTGYVVGRGTLDWDPIYYITFYAGGNIIGMDLFLRDSVPPSDIWGRETFVGLINTLGRNLNIPEWQYIHHREFRTSTTGVNVGNVYPIFRSFLADFGFSGFVIMTIILSTVLTLLYVAIKQKQPTDSGKMDFLTLFYGYCYSNIVLVTMSPAIILHFTAPGMFRNYIVIAFLVLLFNRIRFVSGKTPMSSKQTLLKMDSTMPK